MVPSNGATAADPSSGKTATPAPTSPASANTRRLLASLGINGCAINNVNADLARLIPGIFPADRRRSPPLSAPGESKRSSPSISAAPRLSAALIPSIRSTRASPRWWKTKFNEIYAAIPDLAGFVMKADSEGRVGPSAYHRTHADAANVVARALEPHHGAYLLPRLRLRPPHGLEQPEKRPRPRRLRQFRRPRTASSTTTSSFKSRTDPSISKSANPRPRCSPRSPKPTRPSNCKSPRNTWGKPATWFFWSRSGRKPWTSIWALAPSKH